jgi:hypothetical protein
MCAAAPVTAFHTPAGNLYTGAMVTDTKPPADDRGRDSRRSRLENIPSLPRI